MKRRVTSAILVLSIVIQLVFSYSSAVLILATGSPFGWAMLASRIHITYWWPPYQTNSDSSAIQHNKFAVHLTSAARPGIGRNWFVAVLSGCVELRSNLMSVSGASPSVRLLHNWTAAVARAEPLRRRWIFVREAEKHPRYMVRNIEKTVYGTSSNSYGPPGIPGTAYLYPYLFTWIRKREPLHASSAYT
ncbi:hypothetical protein B0H13DRAFT_1870368 [Mycena leptocephala]|nr:hypothetical protein B0H13DRAFT_1870368 [Mycena leptocephala]